MTVFRISAFFLVLREVLEACLVVGIVLAYLNKSGATQYKKHVWWGTAAGVIISFVIGLSFAIVFYVRGERLFVEKTEKIFEGCTFLLAAALLSWMIVWMAVMGKGLREKMERRLDNIMDRDSDLKSGLGIFFMVFVQVLREGVETWIFLIGAAEAGADDGWKGVPIPGILGILVGLAVSYVVFRGLVELDIQKFFFATSVLLMSFCAGLVSHAFHELQEADWFGTWEGETTLTRDWWNAQLWTTESCCSDSDNEFFGMLRALFGYQDKPNFIEISTYFGYWIIIIVVFACINWSSIRAGRSKTAKIARGMTGMTLLFLFVGFLFSVLNVTWNGVLTMTVGLLLSIVATIAVYDVFSNRISAIQPLRRAFALISGIGFAFLTLFMSVMHIVQMACDEDTASCSVSKFYYWGLIFSPDFVVSGRSEDNYPSVAVLSLSLAMTVFFFGLLSVALILFSCNVSSGDGRYLYDDSSLVKNISDGEGESGESLPETQTTAAEPETEPVFVS